MLSNRVHKIQIRSLTDFLHLYIYETNPSQRHYRSFPDTVSISYTRIQSRQSLLTLNVGHARRRFLGKTIVSVHGLKVEYTPQSPHTTASPLHYASLVVILFLFALTTVSSLRPVTDSTIVVFTLETYASR